MLQISIDANFERLITSGSDNRLLPDADGLNPYGCSPLPRSAIAFGSCTSSSPSSRGVEQARGLLHRLQQAESVEEEAELVCREHRRRLAELLAIPRNVEIALTPSGTDAELLALTLAAGDCNRPVVNIVVGPTEVGSGTPRAAAGLHYDSLVPCGDHVTPGTPVSQELADRVTLQTVDIRDSFGNMLDEVTIDNLVTQTVANAASDAHVILHLVAHSKTGVHAPSLECVQRITRHMGRDVTVVIDAAQGRVSRRGLAEVLDAGHLVIFTGSKFYGGPPFSGALFVPPQWQPRQPEQDVLPAGFEQYFTASEMPETWTGMRQQLAGWHNFGGMLRWSAALAEMDAYYQVSSESRLAVLRAFEEMVPPVIGDSRFIELLPVFPPVQDDSETRLLESKTTVFAFRISVDDRWLTRSELKTLHRELNTDASADSADLAESTLSRRFHLGQPVPFQDGSAALRVALGGELIVRIATDESLGATLTQRIEWMRCQLTYLRGKIELLAAQRESQTPVTQPVAPLVAAP